MKGFFGFVAAILAVILLIGAFSQPLSEGTRVVANGEGFYNPYCHGESRYERWNAIQAARLCQPTLVASQEGEIQQGGDYNESYLNGAYRVVLEKDLVLWFKTSDVKKIE